MPESEAAISIYALEFEHNDGPWTRGDDERKIDGLLRYTQGDWTLMAAAYHNLWNSTDQIGRPGDCRRKLIPSARLRRPLPT